MLFSDNLVYGDAQYNSVRNRAMSLRSINTD